MAEYIEREALLGAVATVAKRLAKSDAQKSLMGRVMYIIDHKSAADVVEVKRGQWEKDYYSQTICSCCKAPIPGYWGMYEDCPDGIWTELKPTKFCPNCGARMDGEQP